MKSTEPTNILKLGVKKTGQSAPTICMVALMSSVVGVLTAHSVLAVCDLNFLCSF